MQKHFNIPIFIPELACPNQCVFCNQRKISGTLDAPDEKEVHKIINEHLKTLPHENSIIEIAFFGGNFTGINISAQKKYLEIANEYIKKGLVNGIRLSTRPDYINEQIIQLLKNHNVTAVELGVQSMDAEVLELSGRGHDIIAVHNAVDLLKNAEIETGMQMMIGLPGDTKEKAIQTAKTIIASGASNTRIYPCLVIKNTQLEDLYNKGIYKPLSIDKSIDWCKHIVPLFEKNNVKILRLGLHPSEGLLNGKDLIAGPFHQSFSELVMSEIWRNVLSEIKNEDNNNSIEIFVSPKQYNVAIGYKASNKNMLEMLFSKVRYKTDDKLIGRDYYVNNN